MAEARMEGQLMVTDSRVLGVDALDDFVTSAEIGDNNADLLATLEEQILPRLVRAHGGPRCDGERHPPTPSEVEAFIALALANDAVGALRFIEDLAREGVAIEDILINLVGATARLLGERWLSDDLSFAEVTVGTSLLQRIVLLFSKHRDEEVPRLGTVALVSPAPEQHTLGVYLLGEFFRRSGFAVHIAVNATEGGLSDLLRSSNFDAVGISVVNDALVPSAGRLVASTRATLGDTFPVLVGGSSASAEIANRLGAFYCSDPRAAVGWVSRVVHGPPDE